MQKLDKKQKQSRLKQYYNELPNLKLQAREKILTELGVHYQTFYWWLDNPEKIPLNKKKRIAQILEVDFKTIFN